MRFTISCCTPSSFFILLPQLTHQVDVYARWVDAFMELQADPGLATGGDAAGEIALQGEAHVCSRLNRHVVFISQDCSLTRTLADGLADFRGGDDSGSDKDDGEEI